MPEPKAPNAPSGRSAAPSASGQDERAKVTIFNLKWDPVKGQMNDLFSKQNLTATILRIKDLEKVHGSYKVGEFNEYLVDTSKLPPEFTTNGGWVGFKKDFNNIPQNRRDEVSDVLQKNFSSAKPLPVIFETRLSAGPNHDAVASIMNQNGTNCINVMYLCAIPAKST